jgi:hypothetical protein
VEYRWVDGGHVPIVAAVLLCAAVLGTALVHGVEGPVAEVPPAAALNGGRSGVWRQRGLIKKPHIYLDVINMHMCFCFFISF